MTNENYDPPEVEIYQLKIRLLKISPMIWRRVLVQSTMSITRLHETIQCMMGWSDEHPHYFMIRGVEYGANDDLNLPFLDNGYLISLKDFNFRLRERFLYEYDLRNRWQHEIRLEKRLDVREGQIYPVCIGGGCATPPERCGGPERFMDLRWDNHPVDMIQRMAEMMSALLEDREAPIDLDELRETLYWYDIGKFDRQKANQRLAARWIDQSLSNVLAGEESP